MVATTLALACCLAATTTHAAPLSPELGSGSALLRLHGAAHSLGARLEDLSAADVWRRDNRANRVDVRVPLTMVGALNASTDVTLMEMLIPNVEQLVAQQRARRTGVWSYAHSLGERKAGRPDPFFDEYRDLATTYAYLERLTLEHPELARLIPSIGSSYEGRDIPAVAIGGHDGGPAVWIQSTAHAREWIASSTAMYMVVELLTSTDPQLRALVEQLRIFVAPVINPDGYVYSFSAEGRMWRKTRSPNDGSACLGTDLNRNWDDHWGGEGMPNPAGCASTDPCSNSYRGANVFSEVEAVAVRDFLASVQVEHSLLGALDLHSFGQMFNRPYGWVDPRDEVPPNDEATSRCGEAMVQAIADATGAPYISQYGHDLYPTCGTGMAWLYNITAPMGTAFTVELRDRGAFGFLLPDTEIRPTGVEMMAAFLAFGSHVLEVRGRDVGHVAAAVPDFKQCDPRWGEELMGLHSPLGEQASICREGCAMSCVAMALVQGGFGEAALLGHGEALDPGSLNKWLQANDGYHCDKGDCNNLVLTAPSNLTGGRVRLVGEWAAAAVSAASLTANLRSGDMAYIAHVRNPSMPSHPVDHFVLVTGYDPAGYYAVHDPYFNTSRYAVQDVADFLLYELLPPAAAVPHGYPLFKQCDPAWAADVIHSKTVCGVGCLMSSISMALRQRGIAVGGAAANPGSLNRWLRAHGGYVNGTDDLEESAVARISPGRVSWTAQSMHRTNDVPWPALVAMLEAGHAVIANVMHGGHFVLVVGYDKADGGDTLYVNDPGFDRRSYSYKQDVVGYRLFQM